jgi:SAM-dependent methyltransferase
MYTWGVDLSEFLLTEAAGRVDLGGRLVRGDMRRLPFADGAFGAVLNMFTSFGYFEVDMDNLMVLGEVSRVLQTGGLLLFDYVNAGRVASMVQEDTVREVEGWRIRESRSIVGDGRFMVKGVEAQNGATGETISYDERVRLYTREDMTTMLDGAGLVVSGLFGDYDRSDFDERGSDRLILLCEKRK